MSDEILLVNYNNEPSGYETKAIVHQKGLLHRAFSVFLLDKNNKLILQKRAKNKYHSAGLWTNTCCSHETKNDHGMSIIDIAKQRMEFELGITVNNLKELYTFHYMAKLDNDIIENEIDTVIIGRIDSLKDIKPNKDEVEELAAISCRELRDMISLKPDLYTEWMKIILEDKRFLKAISN